MSGVPQYLIYLKPEVPGHSYQIHVTDGCGQTWDQSVTWPTVGTPHVQLYFNGGCIDSTATVGFQGFDFQSAIIVTIVSGPTNAVSTKYRYAYTDTITYPKTFTSLYNPTVMTLKDFPPGSYDYIVSDSCGNSVPGTFVIEPYMVSDFKYEWHIKPSCLNNNTLFYNFIIGTPMAVYASVADLATNNIIASPPLNYAEDSLTNLPIGDYALEIYYANHNGNGAAYDGSLIGSSHNCWVLRDTIRIKLYSNNTFITYTTINCNGTNFVELFVDSSRGVPPYQFAIISGPQTFPLQNNTIFQINNFGNYVISMEDACGNNYTQQISLTSDSFPPIKKDGFLCAGQNVTLAAVSSSHFVYQWHYPNGTVYTGDSITFQPFSVLNTGTDTITKIVTINGCADTLTSQYHLTLNDSIPQTFSICIGDTVHVGSHFYTIPGTYYDTLSTGSGCDSVLITTVRYAPPQIVSDSLTICNGDSVVVGIHSYSTQGNYSDTLLLSGGCQKIILTNLSVIAINTTINAVICPGDSIFHYNQFYHQPGTYRDTLTAVSGCDSVLVFQLSLAPPTLLNDSATICAGDSIKLGNNFYSQPGMYIDTVAFGGG